MDERPRGLSASTMARLRREADSADIDVVHDTPRREHWPRARNRPARPSRHDVEWKDLEPALSRPARPWDRPLPRPSMRQGRTGRTHGRAMRREMESPSGGRRSRSMR